MRRLIMLIVALGAIPAQAQVHGVAVQVSQGQPVPTVAQLQMVMRPGDFVRDLAPWAKTDIHCDLTADPGAHIVIPDGLQRLYANVAAAGGRNFVTLAFNNVACGQPSNFGWLGFPNTPELRAEFVAYAVQVVQSVPNLAGISIWNEMNGSFNGAYTGPGAVKARLAAYCQLSNAVILAVRKVNKGIPSPSGRLWDGISRAGS